MANRFWVGGSATWDATAGSKWATTSGGAGGAAVPTAADDVFLDGSSGVGTVTTTNTSVCRSLTCTGFTGTLSLVNDLTALQIGDASGGALTLVSGMTLTIGGGNTRIHFIAQSTNGGTGWGITTAGKTMPGMLFNHASGKWKLLDALSSTAGNANVNVNAGHLDTNGMTVTAAAFASTGTGVRALTLGSSSITVTNASGWNTGTATNLTVNTNAATVTMSAAAATFTTGAINYDGMSLVFTGAGDASIAGGNNITLANLTRTGTAVKTDQLFLSANVTVTGTLTVNGNSTVNRILVRSTIIGTPHTIATAAVSMSNVDFQDVIGVERGRSLDATASTASASSYASASVAPSANRAVIVTVVNSRTSAAADNPSLSGLGLTWTKITSRLNAVSDLRTTVFISQTGGSPPTPGAVTADFGGASQTGCTVIVDQFAGLDLGGTNGSAAYRNVASAASTTATLGAFASSGNPTFAAWGGLSSTALVATTPGVVAYDSALYSTPNVATLTAVHPGNSSSMTATGGDAVVAFELVKTAAQVWDLDAITGGSGDALGNTGITFKTGATQYMTGSGVKNWDDINDWASSSGGAGGSGRIPLPQDDVVVNASSGTSGSNILPNMPRLGRNIDFTGSNPHTLATGGTLSYTIYGSWAGVAGITMANTSFSMTLGGRGTHTISTGGEQITRTLFLNAPGGSYTQTDNLSIVGSNTTWQVQAGSWYTANYSVTAIRLDFFAATASALHLGSSTVTFTNTATDTVVNVANPTLRTVTHSGAVMIVANASNNTRTFQGGGLAWPTLRYNVANSAGQLTINGANSFTGLEIGPGRKVIVPSGTGSISVAAGGLANVQGQNWGYVRLPGVSGSYISTPDASVLDITGDLTLLVRVTLDNYSSGANQLFLGKWTTSNQSYEMYLGPTGAISMALSTDGTSNTTNVTSGAAGLTNGTPYWILASRRQSDGRIQFFKADGTLSNPAASDFTQVGTNQTGTTSSLFSGSALLEIGTNFGGTLNFGIGNFYRAKVYNGVFSTAAFGGTLVFDADFTSKTFGSNTFTESSANAATVTLNGLAQVGDGRVEIASSTSGTKAGLHMQITEEHGHVVTPLGNGLTMAQDYVDFPGVTGNYMTSPDVADLSVMGDLTLASRIALDDWTPASNMTLLSKWVTTTNNRSFLNRIDATTGLPRMFVSEDGVGGNSGTPSSAAPTIADGAALWLLDSWRNSDDRLQFFTAAGSLVEPVASDYTQLGTDRVLAFAGIFDSSTSLEIGSHGEGSNAVAGNYYRAKIYSGVFSTAAFPATEVFDLDLARSGTPSANCSYLKLTDISSVGPGWFYAANSADGGGNNGWVFGDPPVNTGNGFFRLMP